MLDVGMENSLPDDGPLCLLQCRMNQGAEVGVGRRGGSKTESAFECVLAGAPLVAVGLAGGEVDRVAEDGRIGTGQGDPRERGSVPPSVIRLSEDAGRRQTTSRRRRGVQEVPAKGRLRLTEGYRVSENLSRRP